jgi:gliding motility-associated-like protein
MGIKKSIQLFFFVLAAQSSYSQYINVDDTYTANNLVENVLINSNCANVSNISITGSGNSSAESFGFFDGNSSGFPFTSGVLLTTGTALSAIGPNSSIISEGSTNWLGDADLEQALQVNNSVNATILEFDFTPLSNQFSFDYIFSSEQYLSNPSPNQCNFTDGLVFLLKKANTSDTYTNLAVVPNTNIPVKSSTIRGSGTICTPANEQYFDAFNTDQHPTNYNGQTVILKAQSAVDAGETYHIKIVIADQGNNLYDSALFLGAGSFNSTTNIGSDRLISSGNALCEGENLVLTANEPGVNTYKWFKDNVEIIGEITANYTVVSSGIYRVEIALQGTTCIVAGEIKIEYNPLPVLQSPVKLVQCDDNNDGISVFNLTKLDNIIKINNPNLGVVTYYLSQSDANTNTNPITNPTQFLNTTTNQLIAKVLNNSGCASYAVVDLEIANNSLNSINPIIVCDVVGPMDGITAFDLTTLATPQILNGLPNGLIVAYYTTLNNAISEVNSITTNFTNTTANNQIIYARILNGPDCYGIQTITLQVSTFNPTNFQTETAVICPNTSVTLSVPNTFSSYLWTNGATTNSILVSQAGNYSVEVTNANGCLATKNFVVNLSEIPIITNIEVNDLTGNQNTVTITASGNGIYFYSIDGVNFQDNGNFINVLPGNYTAIVTDNLCGSSSPQDFTVLDYPNYFTPNGDGVNDYWFIRNLKPLENVRIYDRYGKFLFSFKGSEAGWNGYYNGREILADDYWFVLTLKNFRVVKGHFALIR